MDFLNQIMTFIQSNGMLIAIGLGIFLFATGRIDLAALLKLLQKPTPTPGPNPTPTPTTPLLDLLQLLLPLLVKAKAKGDAEAEAAILKVMSHAKEE